MRYREPDTLHIKRIWYLLMKLNLNDVWTFPYVKYCAYCADPISADNIDQDFCSARCRHQHYD